MRTAVCYDPYAYEMHADPFPTYARLRAEAPAYRNDERNFWALSRHDDVMRAFRDSATYSSAYGITLDKAGSGPNAHKTSSFIAMDEPRHGHMRGLVSRTFTPRRVAELEPHIRELTRVYLDQLCEAGSGDLIDDLAGRLPMDVISELMGVPAADRDRVRELANLVVHREPDVHDVPPAGMEAALYLVQYYADLVADRRATPRDDLTSGLVATQELSDDDIIGFLFLMVVAGNETTTKLLGNAWYWGWRNPDELAKPMADRALVHDWVEETLRYDTSSHMLGRMTTCDVDLHGVTIPAGERVLLLAGSANRDERVFPDADRYLVGRDNTHTASFGFGRHFCLGASLARLEARVALEEFVTSVRSYDLDESRAERVHSVNVRGFAKLPVALEAR